MKYVSDLHLFSNKLETILTKKKLIKKNGHPDTTAVYNLMYENDQITEDDLKQDRQAVTDKTRAVSNWIKGKHYPKTIYDLLLLCNALECDLDYFFTDMEAPTHDLQFISDTTGLSSDSIEYMRNVSEYELKLLDALLRNGYFNEIAAAIHSYMETRFKNLELQDNFTGNKNLESEKMDIAEYRATKRFSETLVKKIAENKEIQNYSRWDHALEGIHNNPLKPDPAYIRKITEAIRSGKTFNDICEKEGSDS